MLLQKFINNARRSDNMAETLEMQVNWKTPQWKLDTLEKKLNEWIDQDEKRWFKPGTSIGFSKIEFQRALTLTIGIGHNGTWQDWGLRLARKYVLVCLSVHCAFLMVLDWEGRRSMLPHSTSAGSWISRIPSHLNQSFSPIRRHRFWMKLPLRNRLLHPIRLPTQPISSFVE